MASGDISGRICTPPSKIQSAVLEFLFISKALLGPSWAPSPPALGELLMLLCSTSFHILSFIWIKFVSFNWFPPGNTTRICCISASNLHGYVTLLKIFVLPDTAVHCIFPKHLSSSVWYQCSWDPTLELFIQYQIYILFLSYRTLQLFLWLDHFKSHFVHKYT